ncbi:MAG TPA: hypothetical protein VG096_06370 [Bryobacteraceae bacterium]|jgi:predicted neutral ceramidase superfamily lipid hydrolase|nr:hypothetical protein [Bryobacteraceae bacterium]
MKIADYFNLSVSLLAKKPKTPPAPAVSVQGAAAAAPALAPAPAQADSGLSVGLQVGIYAILVSSIVSSRFLDLYRAGIADQFVPDWKYVLSVVIVSLLAFPAVYDRARSTSGQPVLVQIGLIFTTGMGWEKIVATVVGK